MVKAEVMKQIPKYYYYNMTIHCTKKEYTPLGGNGPNRFFYVNLARLLFLNCTLYYNFSFSL